MLLAVDTSTTRAGIALYNGEVVAESVWLAGRDHGRHLMPLIQQTLDRLRLKPSDLTAVAAARGPGSFTGLRVGLAVARGLQVGLGVPLHGVGTLEVLANSLPPLDYPVWAVLAAGRGRYAAAQFRASGGRYVQDGKLMGITVETLLRLAVDRCGIVGDLDAEARMAVSGLGPHVWVAPPALAVRRPAVLAELAWLRIQRGDTPSADAGEPIYLVRE